MGKTQTQGIEEAILEATGEKTQAKGEDRKTYLLRLVRSANKLPEADFNEMPKPAQDWWNDFVEAKQSGKTLPDFPDAEDSDDDDSDVDEDDEPDAPPKRKAKAADLDDEEDDETEDDSDDESEEEEIEDDDVEDSEDEPEEDEEDEDDDETDEDDEPVAAVKPSSKRQTLADDDDETDDEPAPVKRGPGRPKGSKTKPKAQEDDEAEEAPKRGPGRPKGSGNAKSKPAAKEEDENGDEPKKSVRPRLNELVVKNPNRDREKLHALLTKEGFEVKQSSVNVMFYEVVKIIKELNKQGALSKEYAAKLVESE